jgi:hypothetical protein
MFVNTELEGLSKDWSNRSQNILTNMREAVLQLCMGVLVEKKCGCEYAGKVVKALQPKVWTAVLPQLILRDLGSGVGSFKGY